MLRFFSVCSFLLIVYAIAMFTKLSQSLVKFATERDWGKYHHPKNLIINIFVELSELTEHLLSETPLTFEDLAQDEKKMHGIKDEMGDLLINLVHFAGAVEIDINECKAANLDDTISPSQVIHRLNTTIRYIAEPLTWISEEQSRTFEVTEEMPEILREAVELALFFAKQLNLPPIETALVKMEKIMKKFPVDNLPKDVTDFHRTKAKNRKRTP